MSARSLGEEWIKRWQLTIAAIERIHPGNSHLRIDRPASSGELARVEATIGTAIPDEFRQVLLRFSQRVRFYWFLPPGLPPVPLNGIFCGLCDWDVDGMALAYAQFKGMQRAFVEDEPDHRIWQDKFPFLSIGNGDYLAINTANGEPQYVVYLSHELDWSHGYRLGTGLIDFMDRWTQMGCPSDNIWPTFINSRQGPLDLEHPNVGIWRNWLGIVDR